LSRVTTTSSLTISRSSTIEQIICSRNRSDRGDRLPDDEENSAEHRVARDERADAGRAAGQRERRLRHPSRDVWAKQPFQRGD